MCVCVCVFVYVCAPESIGGRLPPPHSYNSASEQSHDQGESEGGGGTALAELKRFSVVLVLKSSVCMSSNLIFRCD